MGKEINAILGAQMILIWTFIWGHSLCMGVCVRVIFLDFQEKKGLTFHVNSQQADNS